jgi:hypothetical protein
MSSVSQIITFRKGRAFTTRKPVPPAVPAPPAPPSAKVTLGRAGGTSAAAAVTYAQPAPKAKPVEIDTRPPGSSSGPWEEPGALPAPRPARADAEAPRAPPAAEKS